MTAAKGADGQTLGLPDGSAAFFRALAEDAGNWSGNPWFDGNVASGRSASGYVARLVKAGLIRSGDDDGHAYAIFTPEGIAAAAKLGIDLTWIDGAGYVGEPTDATEVAEIPAAPAAEVGPERRDHHGAATRSAFLCESGERLCSAHAAEQPAAVRFEVDLHGLNASLERAGKSFRVTADDLTRHGMVPMERPDAPAYAPRQLAAIEAVDLHDAGALW